MSKDPVDLITLIDDLAQFVKDHPEAMKQYPELQVGLLELRQLAKQKLNEQLGRSEKGD